MRLRRDVSTAVLVIAFCARLAAHSGPPFPLVSDRAAGPYLVSIWTDPDATDDGTAAGQFWIMVKLADGRDAVPDTRARVSIRPADRPGAEHAGASTPVNGNVGNQFVALLMDHEGPYTVQAEISGSAGRAVVEAPVDATYDLRPAPWLLAVYVMPFLAVGFLWLKILLRRRHRPGPVEHPALQVSTEDE